MLSDSNSPGGQSLSQCNADQHGLHCCSKLAWRSKVAFGVAFAKWGRGFGVSNAKRFRRCVMTSKMTLGLVVLTFAFAGCSEGTTGSGSKAGSGQQHVVNRPIDNGSSSSGTSSDASGTTGTTGSSTSGTTGSNSGATGSSATGSNSGASGSGAGAAGSNSGATGTSGAAGSGSMNNGAAGAGSNASGSAPSTYAPGQSGAGSQSGAGASANAGSKAPTETTTPPNGR